MFDQFFEGVRAAMDGDRQGWGLADRYEAKGRDDSHEGRLSTALVNAGFQRTSSQYPGKPIRHADGVLEHQDSPGKKLRYELKSVYIPHYHSVEHPHNHDFERLLRHGHPNGALGDIDRLQGSDDDENVFLLIGVSWCNPGESEMLAIYERHRKVLLDAFVMLAGLPMAKEHEVRSLDINKPWSALARAWRITK